MSLIGYARVSTREQHDESQHDVLTEAGCERIFSDKVSGKLASRPQWDRCMDHLRAGDTLVVTRLSRIARSVRNLTDVAATLAEREVELLVLKQHIDTRTPTGRLTFHLLAAIDEFHADLIAENTREGLAAAKARGRHGGRPGKLKPAQVAEIQRKYEAGEATVTELAELFSCTRPTIYRALKPAPVASPA